MNILEKIIAHKKKEVQNLKDSVSIKKLEQSLFFDNKVFSLSEHLKRPNKLGIIAEIKRSSPSTGSLNESVNVEQLSTSYIESGASALSILTDNHFFGGKNQDLQIARKFNSCPILRKDFIIDEFQIIEAKSIGADCILLIAACLEKNQCKYLAQFAKSFGLEVLLEIHSKDEIDSHYNQYLDLIGVNNRNLQTFTTNIANSIQLFENLPKGLTKISESGIKEATDIMQLKQIGFDGFLIGGHFMKTSDPANTCKNLIKKHYQLTQ